METVSAPEVLRKHGGPEPTLPAQNALALVSTGQNTGGSEATFEDPQNRSYALNNVRVEVPPGRLTPNSPRCAGAPHHALWIANPNPAQETCQAPHFPLARHALSLGPSQSLSECLFFRSELDVQLRKIPSGALCFRGAPLDARSGGESSSTSCWLVARE